MGHRGIQDSADDWFWTRGVYGKIQRPQIDSLTPAFAGHQEDEESGWVAVGQRAFIPELTRFITPDPLFRDDPRRLIKSNPSTSRHATYEAESVSQGEASGNTHSEVEAELEFSNPERNPAQDRRLSNSEAKKVGAHMVKDKYFGAIAKFDLYADRQGNIYLKRKGSGGFGKATGYNLSEIK